MSRFDFKAIWPAAAVLAIMVVPLVVWSASSDSGSPQNSGMTVQWDPSKGGDPLLTVTIPERLNKRGTAKNGRDLQLECLDGSGNVVAQTTQPLPFTDDEPGYGAHAHQLVPASRIDSVEKCRLRGARVSLEAPLQR